MKVSKLLKDLGTAFTGTADEIDNISTAAKMAVYFFDAGSLGLFASDLIDGKFNPYLAPFAVDGAVRVTHFVKDEIDYFRNGTPPKEVPGIIGTVREIYQYRRKAA
jgi:hypothetical protein